MARTVRKRLDSDVRRSLATNTGNGFNKGISVYDIDGARYDYLPNGGAWSPPPGIHDALTPDGQGNYYWTKTSGTVYHFYSPLFASSCATSPSPATCGLTGRLIDVQGRNLNNTLTLNYYWIQGNASNASNLSEIQVVAESGLTATLSFSNFGGHTLLSELTRPDGTPITYSYDSSGDLMEVDEPTNSTSFSTCQRIQTCLPQQYSYTGQHLLSTVSNPRWVISDATDGQYIAFSYQPWNGFAEADHWGFINPSVSSPYGSGPIQPSAPTGLTNYRSAFFSLYTGSVPSGETAWTWRDSDLHSTTYFFSTATGAVAERSDSTGTLNLITTSTWDTNENLTATTDARGNETNYAYDSQGNVIAVAKPSALQRQSGGQFGMFRPTSLYSYDSNFNVTAYCDPNFTHSLGKDWQSPPTPSDSLCPAQTGAQIQTFTYPTYEPYGELSVLQKPIGYHYTFTYSASSQGGQDYGLPTQVAGDPITADSNRQPVENYTYDANGNVKTFNNGVGTWNQTFDTENRLLHVVDPDNVNIENYSYNPDDTKSETQTASQLAAGVGVTFQYDADSDKTTEKQPATSSTFQWWYDADDRVIQTSKGWFTRNYYDLSKGSGVGVPGVNGSGKSLKRP